MEDVNAFRFTDRLQTEKGRGDPFAAAVRATRMPMIITDPRQSDNPIVFANESFYRLTGYTHRETLGRNCRFLQGPDTDKADVDAIREAIAARTDISIELRNYRKDGSRFWNALYLSPVFGEDGELQFFFSSQLDVTETRERHSRTKEEKAFFEEAVHKRTAELETALEQKTILLHEVDHRVKNNLQMVAAMIRNQARFAGDGVARAALETTLSRVETLGAVHRRLYESNNVARFDAGDFIRETAKDLVSAANRQDIDLTCEIDRVQVSASVASPLSLLVNELITNALKHAFPPKGQGGTIAVRLVDNGDHAAIVIADDGVGFDATSLDGKSFGQRLLTSLTAQIGGSLDWSEAGPGTRATITLPVEKAKSPSEQGKGS